MADLNISVEGLTRVERFLARHLPAARTAMVAGLKESGTRAASFTKSEMATIKNITHANLLSKRIQSFVNTDNKRAPFARVWVGLKPIYADENPTAVLKALGGKSFLATMKSGHSGLYVRREPGTRRTKHGYRYKGKFFPRPETSSPNLPIETPRIRLTPEVEPVLIDQSRKAVKAEFIRTFRQNFKLF